MQVWRICRDRYAARAFTGEGSKLTPGRWHDGIAMVYTATSIALASVEVFVNLSRSSEPDDLVSIGAHVPDELISASTFGSSSGWMDDLSGAQCAGNRWFAEKVSAALHVPSVAVMGDWNILLNPEHPQFSSVAIGSPKPFRFDPRMFRRA